MMIVTPQNPYEENETQKNETDKNPPDRATPLAIHGLSIPEEFPQPFPSPSTALCEFDLPLMLPPPPPSPPPENAEDSTVDTEGPFQTPTAVWHPLPPEWTPRDALTRTNTSIRITAPTPLPVGPTPESKYRPRVPSEPSSGFSTPRPRSVIYSVTKGQAREMARRQSNSSPVALPPQPPHYAQAHSLPTMFWATDSVDCSTPQQRPYTPTEFDVRGKKEWVPDAAQSVSSVPPPRAPCYEQDEALRRSNGNESLAAPTGGIRRSTGRGHRDKLDTGPMQFQDKGHGDHVAPIEGSLRGEWVEVEPMQRQDGTWVDRREDTYEECFSEPADSSTDAESVQFDGV